VPTILLNTSNDELLGFLLIAGDGPFFSGPAERDCVFTGVPQNVSLFDLPASQFLQANKNQELALSLEFDQSVTEISVTLSDRLSFNATIAETMEGSWYFVDGDTPTDVGRCKLL
jgi:hypothetical protein